MEEIIYNIKDLKNLLVFPDKNANKYSRGVCYVIAGSTKYPGAAVLCSCASLKSGSGYTKLYTSKKNVKTIACSYPSIPTDSFKNIYKIKKLELCSKKPISIVIGPGFIPNKQKHKELLLYVLNKFLCPVIIDGGALSYLYFNDIKKAVLERYEKNLDTILTPHIGEAKRIYKYFTNQEISNLQYKDFAQELNKLSKCVIVLKGTDVCICDSNNIYTMIYGDASLSKAGSGDILAGILGGIICQNKISVFDACIIGSVIHAFAGIEAKNKITTICVCPEDILSCIPYAIKKINNDN